MSDAEIVQGSREWFAIRCGKVTASRVADIMARTKTGYGASRANYMAELIAERLTGEPAEKFSNAAMQWGTEKEPEARMTYSLRTGADVVQVGFVAHPGIAMAGASPDGLVGEGGLVEFKCPNTATHIETLLTGAIPQKYITQTHFQMLCAKRQWTDYVSFDPRMPATMRLFIKQIPFDHKFGAEIETEVRAFIKELDAKVDDLRALYERREAA